MICTNCNNEIPPEAIFCPVCGKKVMVQSLCPVCGSVIDEGSNFCIKCGSSVSPSAPNANHHLQNAYADQSCASDTADENVIPEDSGANGNMNNMGSGSIMFPDSEETDNTPVVKHKKRGWVILLVTISVVAVIVCCLYFMLKSRDSDIGSTFSESISNVNSKSTSSSKSSKKWDSSYQDLLNEWGSISKNLGSSLSSYSSNYYRVTDWYDKLSSNLEKVCATMVEAYPSRYNAITASDYDTWDSAMEDLYDEWDRQIEDMYDDWDRMLEDAYDFMDRLIEDNFDNVSYSEYSDAWEKMYRDYSDTWSACYRIHSDTWTDLYRDYSDAWTDGYRDKVWN